jgi:hypothetical protein
VVWVLFVFTVNRHAGRKSDVSSDQLTRIFIDADCPHTGGADIDTEEGGAVMLLPYAGRYQGSSTTVGGVQSSALCSATTLV